MSQSGPVESAPPALSPVELLPLVLELEELLLELISPELVIGTDVPGGPVSPVVASAPGLQEPSAATHAHVALMRFMGKSVPEARHRSCVSI